VNLNTIHELVQVFQNHHYFEFFKNSLVVVKIPTTNSLLKYQQIRDYAVLHPH
jgi:hypothetical protein